MVKGIGQVGSGKGYRSAFLLHLIFVICPIYLAFFIGVGGGGHQKTYILS